MQTKQLQKYLDKISALKQVLNVLSICALFIITSINISSTKLSTSKISIFAIIFIETISILFSLILKGFSQILSKLSSILFATLLFIFLSI